MAHSLDLSVIMVNYNGMPWLEACLESLVRQVEGLAYEMIVIDNASTDGSERFLQNAYPWLNLIANQENVGFAQANNQAIGLAQGKYILLLNNDTLFQSGLREMLDYLDQHSTCAAVGPQMLDGAGRPRGSWGYFPTLARLLATMLLLDRLPFVRARLGSLLVRSNQPDFFRSTHAVDWASGACLLVRREIFERVGLLDPYHFMYGEEVEWCYRVWQAGYQVCVLPQAQLVHYGAGGQEWRHWKGASATINAYKNFLYFYSKHLPRWQKPVLRLGIIAGSGLRLLGGLLLYLRENGQNRARARQVVMAYVRVLRFALGLKVS